MKAILKTYRQSPRKVRLLVDLIKGKKVSDALKTLQFTVKRSSPVVLKLLKSAISNAKNISSVNEDDLFVKEATVNQGIVMKRIMPRARGSAAPIHKKTSHISIILGVKGGELPAPKKEKRESMKKEEKVVKKVTKKVKTKNKQ